MSESLNDPVTISLCIFEESNVIEITAQSDTLIAGYQVGFLDAEGNPVSLLSGFGGATGENEDFQVAPNSIAEGGAVNHFCPVGVGLRA